MTALRDKVIAILAAHPQGISSNDVAKIMGRAPASTSALLSKGVYYNYWSRRDFVEHGRRHTVWLPPIPVPPFVPPRRGRVTTEDVP